jgi:hypothetical protein
MGRSDVGMSAFGEAPVELLVPDPERLSQQDRQVRGPASS